MKLLAVILRSCRQKTSSSPVGANNYSPLPEFGDELNSRVNVTRRLAIALTLTVIAPALALAQSPAKVGILVQEMERAQSQSIKGLGDGLKSLGYQERKNLFFEIRNVKGNRAQLQPAAGELITQKVGVIFTTGSSATRAAIASTQDIPIVFVHPGDPVAAGLMKNHAERAKNLTGVAAYAAATTEQRLTLFKQIIPALQKIVVFYDGNNAFSRENFAAADAAAKKLGLQVHGYPIRSSDELKSTIAGLRTEPGAGIFQIPDDLFESESELLFDTARTKKLPTMFNEEAWAIRGALAAYGPSYLEMGQQAARLIDRIIKGEKPEALPIERASKFGVTLNYRTARFIDLSFPAEMLKKANKVIR
jgi:putative tryptophan/tyrosine transport system substrate-binding protein